MRQSNVSPRPNDESKLLLLLRLRLALAAGTENFSLYLLLVGFILLQRLVLNHNFCEEYPITILSSSQQALDEDTIPIPNKSTQYDHIMPAPIPADVKETLSKLTGPQQVILRKYIGSLRAELKECEDEIRTLKDPEASGGDNHHYHGTFRAYCC